MHLIPLTHKELEAVTHALDTTLIELEQKNDRTNTKRYKTLKALYLKLPSCRYREIIALTHTTGFIDPVKPTSPQMIKAWRKPTPSEIKFGYGAIHWAEFPRMDWQRNNGTLKRWIKKDNKRYNRI